MRPAILPERTDAVTVQGVTNDLVVPDVFGGSAAGRQVQVEQYHGEVGPGHRKGRCGVAEFCKGGRAGAKHDRYPGSGDGPGCVQGPETEPDPLSVGGAAAAQILDAFEVGAEYGVSVGASGVGGPGSQAGSDRLGQAHGGLGEGPRVLWRWCGPRVRLGAVFVLEKLFGEVGKAGGGGHGRSFSMVSCSISSLRR